MKRIISFVVALALALFLSLSACGAESKADEYANVSETENSGEGASPEGITFRNFEWGITKSEVEEYIEEHQDEISRPSDIPAALQNSIGNLLPHMRVLSDDAERQTEKEYHRYWVNYSTLNWSVQNELQVAGYEAYLEMRFANPVVNGEIEENSDSGKFFEAEYDIHFMEKLDADRAFSDLLEKLTSLYGDDSIVGQGLDMWEYTISSQDKEIQSRLLKGNDNSRILISEIENTFGFTTYHVYIVYFAPNIYDLASDSVEYYQERDRANNEKKQAEEDAFKNNTDGL